MAAFDGIETDILIFELMSLLCRSRVGFVRAEFVVNCSQTNSHQCPASRTSECGTMDHPLPDCST
jgi:hypothetical protein